MNSFGLCDNRFAMFDALINSIGVLFALISVSTEQFKSVVLESVTCRLTFVTVRSGWSTLLESVFDSVSACLFELRETSSSFDHYV